MPACHVVAFRPIGSGFPICAAEGIRCAASCYSEHRRADKKLSAAVGAHTPTLSSGGIPGEVALGDVNGDGNLDIVVINPCGNTICPNVKSPATVAVLLGNGQGGFGPPTLYKTGGRLSSSVALADLDGDGHLDIVTTSECPSKGYCDDQAGVVSVFYGIGNGQFQTPVTYFTYSIGTVSVALGDVDGDGRPDIIVASQCADPISCDIGLYGSIGVMLSSTGFQPMQVYNSGGNRTQSVQIADVNGDGIPDLVAASRCPAGNDCSFAYGYTSSGTVSVLLGTGTGTFQAATAYDSGGIEPYAAMVSDVNGDGKPDLIAFNLIDENGGDTENASVRVLLGKGDGTFGSAMTYAAGAYATGAAVQDVNGDGKPDILVATTCTTQNSVSGCLGVLLGNGNGTFQSAPIYAPGGYATYFLAESDLNRDGKADLITVSQCNSLDECINGPPHHPVLGVLLGNGDGTFQPPALYNPGVYPTGVIAGDVNGDGIPDIVVLGCSAMTTCTGEASVLLGNGDGTFKPAVTYSADGLFPSSVAIGDINGDGKADLVVANSFIALNVNSGGVAVLLGNGDGTFQPAVSYSSGGYLADSVSIGDLNGDGKLDVVVANGFAVDYTSTNGIVGVLLGNGDGTLKTAVTYPTTGVFSSAVMGDFNGDGRPDLVVENPCLAFSTSGCATSSVNTFLGNGDGTFQAPINIARPPFDGVQSVEVALADFNGDGKPDVAFGTGEIVLLGNGDGTFQFVPLGAGGVGIATGDFNGDGRPDIAVGGVAVLLNISSGAATAVVSPNSVNFGNQTVSMTSSAQTVILTNTGTAPLNLSSISVGVNNGSATATNNCGTSVAAGASCTVAVSWTPGSTGNMTGSLTFTDSASNSPQVVSLSGAGVLPTVILSPLKLIFSNQVVFTTSASQTATLTNTGLGVLSISKISASGPFVQTNNCGTTLASGASCTFTVAFRPTTIGTINGSIVITDNGPKSTQTLALTGFGTYVSLAPTSLTFGNQTVGTKSLPKRVTLSNKGSVAVSITGISFTGTNASDFAETNTCGPSVAAGGSCFIQVTFTPSAKGNRTATLSVTDNGGASPQKASVAGTGT